MTDRWLDVSPFSYFLPLFISWYPSWQVLHIWTCNAHKSTILKKGKNNQSKASSMHSLILPRQDEGCFPSVISLHHIICFFKKGFDDIPLSIDYFLWMETRGRDFDWFTLGAVTCLPCHSYPAHMTWVWRMKIEEMMIEMEMGMMNLMEMEIMGVEMIEMVLAILAPTPSILPTSHMTWAAGWKLGRRERGSREGGGS